MTPTEAIAVQHEGWPHAAQPCFVGDFPCDVQTLLGEIATLRAALDGLVEAAVPALAWMAEKCVPDGAEYAAEGHLFSLSIGELNDGEAIRDTLRAALATAKETP